MWREVKQFGLVPYNHRAYFTSYMGAYPLMDALKNRRYIGRPLQGGGYVMCWD